MNPKNKFISQAVTIVTAMIVLSCLAKHISDFGMVAGYFTKPSVEHGVDGKRWNISTGIKHPSGEVFE